MEERTEEEQKRDFSRFVLHNAYKLNPSGRDLIQIVVCPQYGVNTLINGNISECINYLRELISAGSTGVNIAYEELNDIKELCPERYEYVKEKVFS